MRRTRPRRRAGLSLLEVMVSAGLLAGITLVALSSAMPLTRASAGAALGLELDQAARRVLAELRRELRASGYDRGAARFGAEAVGDGGLSLAPRPSIVFARRTDEDTWSGHVTWRRDPTTGAVERTSGPPGAQHTVELARHAAGLTFRVLPGDRVCDVTLVLSRTDPSDGTTITRTYVDRVEMMNR